MSDSDFAKQYGSWALITGASAGIGRTFAEVLAKKGLNLILVARRESLLDELAQQLEQHHEISTRVIVADMSDTSEVNRVIEQSADLEIGLVIPNAGIETHELFDQQSWQQVDSLLQINMAAPTRLAHHFAGQMRQRGRGGILFVSSIMAYMPSAYLAQYAASKAYIQLLAEGMHKELKSSGVDVTVLAPGLTDTDMGQSVTGGLNAMFRQPLMDPKAVVQAGLSALGKRPVRIAGWMNQLNVFMVSRLLPRAFSTALTHKMFNKH
ncbi:SDR family NAD(P)-dependent oxidoreductase [Endozoicomonas sp.]|uniref:SDR family NAD(P)-dependent oxidoreductase n=1 Tax=Endozoicomonas sp. TaxID=1892382 RepID=UPI003AF9B710